MMKMRLFVTTCAFVLLSLTVGAQPVLAAQSAAPASAVQQPAQQTSGAAGVVKNFYDQLLAAMKQGDQFGYAGRFKKLDPAVRTAFNLPLMTRVAVGSVWNNATPDEQKQLTDAFSTFSVANYASQFKSWDGEQFTIGETKPTADGAIVETKLQPKDGDAVALNYLMKQDDAGKWRIVDVFLDGTISQLATRRSEFTSIVNHDGIEALVNSLGEKSKQMGPS